MVATILLKAHFVLQNAAGYESLSKRSHQMFTGCAVKKKKVRCHSKSEEWRNSSGQRISKIQQGIQTPDEDVAK